MPELGRLADRIAADLVDVRWPDAADIRRTARIRRNRRAAVAALLAVAAVVGVVGVPAAMSYRDRGVQQVAAPPTAPEQRTLPPEALLTADEVGTALEVQFGDGGTGSTMPTEAGLIMCMTEKRLDPDRQTRYASRLTLLKSVSAGTEHTSADLVLNQRLYRLAPADARAYLTDLRRALEACDGYISSGTIEWKDRTVDAQGEFRFEVVAANFAGDESIQIAASEESRIVATGETIGRSGPRFTAAIRVGDLVTVISPRIGTSASDLRRWSVLAAQRMCPAANPPC